jgi:transposase InsO family protein
VKYACIAAHGGQYPVALMCRVLEVARAGYYAAQRRGPSARARRDTQLRVAIRVVHAASRQRYGSPRVYRTLQQAGEPCSQKRVARLMRAEGLRGRRARPYRATTQADGRHAPAPHVLQRAFAAAAPHRVWVSDVTACPTAAGWLYLAVVLELASRRVVGWATGAQPDQGLTGRALQQALVRRPPAPGWLHHSDRGSHYTAAAYQRVLVAHGAVVSMSRRGNCWDNAVAESFFATLKTELVRGAAWQSRAEGARAVAAYVTWYNQRRLHSTLGYCSPAQFEARHVA